MIIINFFKRIWETKLNNFSEKIEYISDDLKRGHKLQLELDDILKKLGELFTMRHMVNLYSNFLETPDFYWVLIIFLILNRISNQLILFEIKKLN